MCWIYSILERLVTKTSNQLGYCLQLLLCNTVNATLRCDFFSSTCFPSPHQLNYWRALRGCRRFDCPRSTGCSPTYGPIPAGRIKCRRGSRQCCFLSIPCNPWLLEPLKNNLMVLLYRPDLLELDLSLPVFELLLAAWNPEELEAIERDEGEVDGKGEANNFKHKIYNDLIVLIFQIFFLVR